MRGQSLGAQLASLMPGLSHSEVKAGGNGVLVSVGRGYVPEYIFAIFLNRPS